MQDSARSYMESLLKSHNIVYYLVAISVLLLGIVFMSSSQSSNQLPEDSKGGHSGKKDPISRCTHPLLLRDQLFGEESLRAVFLMRCSQGFKVVENYRRGSFCRQCGSTFCPNPGCACKRI
jgi:hypothetical protein